MTTTTSILGVSRDPVEMIQKHFAIDITIPQADVLVVTSDTSIGIDMIRDLHTFAYHPPLIKKQKFIVIPHAETLTIEAQNALLKILEEPPAHTQLILCAPHTQSFLETILSRCHIIRDTQDQPVIKTQLQLPDILKTPAPARLSHLPPIKGKEDTITYIRQLIQEAEMLLAANPTRTSTHNLAVLTTCLEHLTKNANPALALTDALLQLT